MAETLISVKKNVADFTEAEKVEARNDFGVHAWLANWDAVGTGGDNQVIKNGHVHTVDVGGALKYRAKGGAKGDLFGTEVTETKSLLDPVKNPDSAKLFGPMTNAEKIEAYKRVTQITDGEIRNTVLKNGGDTAMADKLVARKNDLLWQQHVLEDPAFEAKHPRGPGGKFAKKPDADIGKEGPNDHLLKVSREVTPERVALRKALLVETDEAKKQAMKQKIIDSFALNYKKTGNETVKMKLEKTSKKYGMKPTGEGAAISAVLKPVEAGGYKSLPGYIPEAPKIKVPKNFSPEDAETCVN